MSSSPKKKVKSSPSKSRNISRPRPIYRNESDSDSEYSDQELDVHSYLKESMGDAYIHANSKPGKTSDHRISSAFDKPFTLETYRQTLAQVDESDLLATARPDIEKAYAVRYDLWSFELEQGYSLLFHGYGSKRNLLLDFARQKLSKRGNVVVASAYQPGVSIVDILNAVEKLLPSPDCETSPRKSKTQSSLQAGDKNERRALHICQCLAEDEAIRPIYILVHNLESPGMATSKSKTVLAMLAAQPKVHLLASVDHLRSMLLFPTSMSTAITNTEDDDIKPGTARGFAFLHHHTPTYAPYTEETLAAGLPSLLFPPSVFPSVSDLLSGSGSSSARMQGIQSVLSSLNDNSTNLFKALAKQQLAAHANLDAEAIKDINVNSTATAPLVAVKYTVLFAHARDNFFASSETQMDTLLTEFKDHGIIASSHNEPQNVAADADENAVPSEWIWVKLPQATLAELVDWLG